MSPALLLPVQAMTGEASGCYWVASGIACLARQVSGSATIGTSMAMASSGQPSFPSCWAPTQASW